MQFAQLAAIQHTGIVRRRVFAPVRTPEKIHLHSMIVKGLSLFFFHVLSLSKRMISSAYVSSDDACSKHQLEKSPVYMVLSLLRYLKFERRDKKFKFTPKRLPWLNWVAPVGN